MPSHPDTRPASEQTASEQNVPMLEGAQEGALEGQLDDDTGFVVTAERVPIFSWGSGSAPSLPSVESGGASMTVSTWMSRYAWHGPGISEANFGESCFGDHCVRG
jgi:hypothetical protein